tara:strand:- start:419 stop:1288 length:870 start_codon:yes stop_codon:yes gene_type:complete
MSKNLNTNKVHIVVLTWNNKTILKRCLESLENINHKNNMYDYTNFTVNVIDNNSSDNSAEMIAKKFPKVKVIKNRKNLKFGAGYNAGLKKMNFHDNDFIILLNDDTIVSRDFIDELINPLLNDRKAIISVPKILFSSNINKIWFAGGVVDLWRGLIYHIGIRDFDGPKYSFISETQYATGCCLCLRYIDLEKINFFDETFDMYCEDVDLSLKARQLNRKIIYAPKSVILHSVSQSLGEHSSKKNIMKLKNQLKLFWKHATGIQLISISFYWVLFHLPYQFIRWLYLRKK